MDREILLEIKELSKSFRIKNFFGNIKGEVKAVDNISFQIGRGETFGLVGESGCGKSTLGRLILQMLQADSGSVYYEGKDLVGMDEAGRKKIRNKLQIIFQDPYSALNPNWNVRELIAEPLIASGASDEEIEKRIKELLRVLNMNEEDMEKFPYEFSGGQRQRIGIARAVATYPKFIFCDEPVSALDVSVQAQVINMLKDLQEEMELTYLFTAHDLSMVYHISDRIGVMYLGTLVEIGTSEEVFHEPLHPYTQALISAIPIADPEIGKSKKPEMIKGELPSPMNVPKGCRFCTRCPYAEEICREEAPEMKEVTQGHMVACHLSQISQCVL